MISIAGGLVLALSLAAPAMADEPGPGGSKPPVPKTGDQVYQMVCQACHMADAKGAVGAGTFPALANNPKLEDRGLSDRHGHQAAGAACPGSATCSAPSRPRR
jgi:mono/diheme cytochrome c family protein